MPWYDSALGMALGWKELGPLLVQIGGNSSRPDITAEGKQMITDAADLITNIATSLNRSKGVKSDRMKLYNDTCCKCRSKHLGSIERRNVWDVF